jgi:hypothetical protein
MPTIRCSGIALISAPIPGQARRCCTQQNRSVSRIARSGLAQQQ